MITIIETASVRKAAMRLLSTNRPENQEHSDEHSTEMNLKEGFWFGFQTLFSTQDNGMLDTKLTRVVVWLWQLSIFTILSGYTATYTNILASNRMEWSIGGVLGKGADTYTTLSAAVEACPFCISVQKGGAGENYLSGTLRMDFSKVQNEKEAPFPLASSSDKIEQIRTMLEDTGSIRSVWIDKAVSMKYVTDQVMVRTIDKSNVCNWKTVGAEFGISAQAIPFAPTLPKSTADAIDTIITRLVDDLSLKSLENQWFPAWPECLLIKEESWRPMAAEDFTILFAVVSLLTTVSFVYRIITDYSVAIQMNPEKHRGLLAFFFKTKLGKLLFGFDLKSLDRPFSSHAILCEVKRHLVEANDFHRTHTTNCTTDEVWVRKYSRSRGVYFYVNNFTGEYSWNGPETALNTSNPVRGEFAAFHCRHRGRVAADKVFLSEASLLYCTANQTLNNNVASNSSLVDPRFDVGRETRLDGDQSDVDARSCSMASET